LADDVPVVIAFKALGIEADQEICMMIGVEEEILSALGPCIEECHRAQVW